MGARSSQSRGPGLNSSDGHLLKYFRDTFSGGGGAILGPQGVIEASGGYEYLPGDGYKYHKFTSNDNFVVSVGGNVDILVIAGGGSGGNYYGAGGGGGGVAHGLNVPLSAGTYPAVIGAGGARQETANAIGLVGNDSTFGAPGVAIAGQPDYILAKGGGAGGHGYTTANGGAGGSGGGDSGGNSPAYGGLANQPGTNPSPLITDHGFPGGWSFPEGGYAPAGGGGAGAQGTNIPSSISGGGDGGAGVVITGFPYPKVGLSSYSVGVTTISPSNNHYGGGGGAGIYSDATEPDRMGDGGFGGGGFDQANTNAPLPGVDSMGGGGAGRHPPGGTGASGKGGDGVVIIKYLA
jgi:hypothetical protein